MMLKVVLSVLVVAAAAVSVLALIHREVRRQDALREVNRILREKRRIRCGKK